MRKFKRLAVLALSASLAVSAFTGCGKSEENETTTDKTGESVDRDDTLITIGDTKIPYWVGEFYAYNQQASYESYYLANGYSIDWSSAYQADGEDDKESDGKTIEELVKQDTLDRIEMFYIIEAYAKENNLTLDEDDNKQIEEYVKKYLDGNEKVLAATKVSEEELRTLYTVESYYNKGCELLFKDKDFDIDEEEYRECRVYAVEVGESAVEFAEDTANAILKRVQNGEDISEVAKAYGLEAVEGNCGKGDFKGDSVEKLCLSLKTGESGVTKEDDTYMVIYCIEEKDETATSVAVEEQVSKLKSAELKKFFDEYSKKNKITLNEKLWAKINFSNSILTTDDVEDILNKETTSNGDTTTDSETKANSETKADSEKVTEE